MKSKIEFVEKNALGGARVSREGNDALVSFKENNRNLYNQT
jgi:hypothetical protein